MELLLLGAVELRYTSLNVLDIGDGGQVYGGMAGSITGEQLSGALQLTNLARRRPDNINEPM